MARRFVVKQGTTRFETSVLRFASGTLTQVNGEAVIDVSGGGGGGVPTSLVLTATAPLTGGGNLSANRSFGLSYGSGLTLSGSSLVVDTSTIATLAAVVAGYQPLDADLTALAALGDGFPYRAGGTWGATAAGDLAVSGASIQVSQARGLRETAGPTTLAIGAVADGQLLGRSTTTIIGFNVSATPTANYIVKADASGKVDGWVTDGTTAAKGKLQLAVDGESSPSKPPMSSDSRLSGGSTSLNAAYGMWFQLKTDGASLLGIGTATGGGVTGTGSITYAFVTSRTFPDGAMSVTGSGSIAAIRTSAQTCILNQNATHQFAVVCASATTNHRIWLGCAVSIGTAIKPTGAAVAIVYDPGTSANWQFLTYDGSAGSETRYDTGLAYTVNQAIEAEVTVSSGSCSGRVRIAGGTWTAAQTATTNLPGATTAMYHINQIVRTAAGGPSIIYWRGSSMSAPYV